MIPPGKRATSLKELQAIRSRFDPSESIAHGLSYQAEPSDVFIATYPKCGTTWLQQIMHCLRSNGDMDYPEITAVIPWLEMALVMGIEPTAAPPAEPRIFKTHLSFERIPKGGRYVHMIRDPEDALVSMYHFHEGWFFEPGSISLEDYAIEQFLAGGRSGNYWQFQASWWPHRADPDVLYLAYEHALKEPRKTIERIAAFLGIESNERLLTLTEEHSSLAFMKRHAGRFDDNLWRAATQRFHRLPEDSTTTKVRNGKAGEGKIRLSDDVRAALQHEWDKELRHKFGLASYPELCEALLGGSQ